MGKVSSFAGKVISLDINDIIILSGVQVQFIQDPGIVSGQAVTRYACVQVSTLHTSDMSIHQKHSHD